MPQRSPWLWSCCLLLPALRADRQLPLLELLWLGAARGPHYTQSMAEARREEQMTAISPAPNRAAASPIPPGGACDGGMSCRCLCCLGDAVRKLRQACCCFGRGAAVGVRDESGGGQPGDGAGALVARPPPPDGAADWAYGLPYDVHRRVLLAAAAQDPSCTAAGLARLANVHPVWRQVALRTPGYEYVPGFDPRAVRARRLGVLEQLDRLAEESEWTQYNHGARLGCRYFGRGTDAEGRNPRDITLQMPSEGVADVRVAKCVFWSGSEFANQYGRAAARESPNRRREACEGC